MNIFLDIETIPFGDLVDPMTMTPPGNISKPETIAAWYKDKAIDIAAEKYRARALDSMQGNILCIGYAIGDEPSEIITTEYLDSERDALSVFRDVVNGIEPITFIGWNIVAFDIPFIWRKAIKYGLIGLRNAFNRDRYKGNHLDLMLAWGADWKDFRKLDDVAQFLGLPGKLGGLTGATIYDAYLEGRMDEITAYCKNDVETVRAIYRKIFE
uniref:Putative DNA polymerase n=1 Tax=viral metagenome TaxID=1070528 RepID=A0A6M3IU37_9ZZZZ